MPGIPSKDASFVWGTPRNYALTLNQLLDDYRKINERLTDTCEK